MKTSKPKPKDYFFYCIICGVQFQARRADAKTDSDECRLAYSEITRDLKSRTLNPEKPATPEQKEVVQNLVDSATGKGRVFKKVFKGEKTPIKPDEQKPDATPETKPEVKDVSDDKTNTSKK